MYSFKMSTYLSPEQIKLAYTCKTKELILKHVIMPNLDEINYLTGKTNDPIYLSYMCAYIVAGF